MYNKTIIAGHLTRDIELKHIPSGTAIASSSIATTYKYGDKEETCFLEFTAFGKPAEILAQYIRKGSKVLLDGRLILEQWDDKNTGTKRSRHTLRVETFKFLDSKGDNNSGASNNSSNSYSNNSSYGNGSNQTAPAQNNYNNQAQPSQNTPNQSINEVKKEELPSINIDDDEIPF